jgi:multiple sugar transport system permease protein
MVSNNQVRQISGKKKVLPVFLQIIIVIVIIIYMLPVIYMGITSFKPWNAIFKVPPTFHFAPTVASFIRLFYETRDYPAGKEPTPEEVAKMDWKNKLMWQETNQKLAGLNEGPARFLNSVIISTISTIFSVILGTITAYALSRFRVRGKGDVMFFILSQRMLPAVVVTVPLFLMFRFLRLSDTHFGLILLYMAFNTPFAVWVMKGFIDDIPLEYEEAALVDGYTRMQAFRKITLPQAATGIAATTVFCYIFSWNEYAFALIMTTRVASTATVYIQGIKGSLGIDWGAIIAGSFLFFIPVAIFTFLMRKYLLAGITFGAIRK